MRLCRVCSVELSTENTYSDKIKICKSCDKIRVGKRVKEQRKIKFSRTWFYKKYSDLKRRAKLRGKPFVLTFDEFVALKSQKTCTYCSADLSVVTIDRSNNSVGYVAENCVVSCYRCNFYKSNKFTADEMMILGKALGVIDGMRAFR